MIKIVYRVVIKRGREKEFKILAEKVLVPHASQLTGCVLFTFFDNHINPCEFIFYEIWKNEEAVNNYYKELILLLGKNSPGKIFPDKFNDFIEEEENILHQEIVETK